MRKISRDRKWKKRSEVLPSLEQREHGLCSALQEDAISSMEIMEMMDEEKIRQVLR